jgi:dihydroflavonol-4-reductase
MRVLVTGATGLLGNNIVRALLNRHFKVKLFVRESSKLKAFAGLIYEKYVGNILNEKDVLNASKDCEVIIHAAANTDQWPTDYKHYEPVNIKATQIIISAVKKNNIKKLIYVSTANAFGYGSKRNPGNELTEFNSFRLNSGYINSKYIAQQIILNEVEKYNIPAVIVNPTFMIGSYDSKPSSGKIILMALNNRFQICPPGGKNFIYAKDAAIGVCNAITKGQVGECYLLANENLTYREFFSLTKKVIKKKKLLICIPGFIIKLIGLSGSLYEILTKKQAKLNYVNSRLLCLNNYYSAKKAVKDLQLPQTPVKIAVSESVNWFRSNKYSN